MRKPTKKTAVIEIKVPVPAGTLIRDIKAATKEALATIPETPMMGWPKATVRKVDFDR